MQPFEPRVENPYLHNERTDDKSEMVITMHILIKSRSSLFLLLSYKISSYLFACSKSVIDMPSAY
jgi:hypothetical protein